MDRMNRITETADRMTAGKSEYGDGRTIGTGERPQAPAVRRDPTLLRSYAPTLPPFSRSYAPTLPPFSRSALRLVALGVAMLVLSAPAPAAETGPPPKLVVDTMEDLTPWHTGGQKEARLAPERTLVTEGKQALRFDVKIDHQADESIQGKQYPMGWPRVERNPAPPLDLSAIGGITFDIYTLSSRKTMPGSALHIIMNDAGGEGWSANLGELPLGQWKHVRLDFGNLKRTQIKHWQFFLSESDYQDGDEVSFVIDNVQGYAAQRSRELVPRLGAKLAALRTLAGPAPAEETARTLAAVAQSVASAQSRLPLVDQMALGVSNAFDRECERLLERLSALAMRVGAAQTVADSSYCVGVETSLRKVFRDDEEFTPGRALHLTVAGNEREAGQVLVRAITRDIPRLSAEWSDLVGPGGARIGRDRLHVDAVGYVEMLKASYRTQRQGWWPDPLLPLDWVGSGKAGLGPLADAFARTGETQPLWVSVCCPTGTRAGEYRGTLTLRPEGLAATTLSVSVQVRSFSLPLRPRLKTAFSFFEGQMTGFSKQRALTPEQRRACEAFLLERKTNPMMLYTPFAWPGLEDVPFMAERGLNAYCLGYTPSTVQDLGELCYYRWVRDQRRWLAERGLDRDAWLYGFDEPNCRPDFAAYATVMRDVYALTEAAAPGLPRASTTVIVPGLVGAVSLWVPQTMHVVPKDILARQQAGDQVWTYVVCSPTHPFANIFIDYPALEHRLLFWQTWQYKCTGFLYYATNLWRPNFEGQAERWPEVPWNPRPEKDFAFNGDGILLYPGPHATLLSSVRQEVITDGIEDYDYLCLLRDAAQALSKHSPQQAELVRRAQAAAEVPASLSATLTEFGHDPAVLLQQRDRVGDLLEQVRAALPPGAWQEVLTSEPPLAPPAPREAPVPTFPTPFVAGFETGDDMAPWVSTGVGEVVARREAVTGMGGKLCAVSRGRGQGWADWESPYLQVEAGRSYAVRLSVSAQLTHGAARVFLFKYDKDRTPLDLPTRARGTMGPALIGRIDGTTPWEKRRFVRQMEPGVALVRL